MARLLISYRKGCSQFRIKAISEARWIWINLIFCQRYETGIRSTHNWFSIRYRAIKLSIGGKRSFKRFSWLVRLFRAFSTGEAFFSVASPLCGYFLCLLLSLFPFYYSEGHVISSWSRVLPEKLTGSELVKRFPAFYETSIPHSQSPATYIYPEPEQSSPCSPSHFLKIHFNITLLPMTRSSKWSVSLRFLHQNPVCTSPLPHTGHKLRPSHSPWLDHPNDIW